MERWENVPRVVHFLSRFKLVIEESKRDGVFLPKYSTYNHLQSCLHSGKTRRRGVAENYTPFSSQMKQDFTCLRNLRNQEFSYTGCSESVKFTAV